MVTNLTIFHNGFIGPGFRILCIPYSLENNVALYSYNADRNSHYTRGRVIFKVALYSFMSI